MAERFLAVDLGNSRCKLGVFAGARRLEAAAFAVGEALPGEVDAWLRSRPAATRAALCSVAAPALAGSVAEVLRDRVAGPVDTSPEAGLELAVRSPETVGHDRLFAARGALLEVGGACVVVDAGTALTVDAVTPDAGAGAHGTFLGGAIAPGPALLARALESGGARLPRVEPRCGAPALGRDTRAALEAGIAVGFAGAARALVEGVAREAGLDGTPVVVTGGARAFLLESLVEAGHRTHVVDDLVLVGLRAAAEASA